MLMMSGKKKLASAIVGKLKGSPDFPGASKEPEVEVDPGMMTAAEDLLSAIESKDAKKVMSALKSAYLMCEAKEDSQES